jgi:hypothetical protein
MAVLYLRTVCVTKQAVSVVRSKGHSQRTEKNGSHPDCTQTTRDDGKQGVDSAEAMLTKDLHLNCP